MRLHTTSPNHLWLTGQESADGDAVMAHLRQYPIEVDGRPHHEYPLVWVEKAEIIRLSMDLERAEDFFAEVNAASLV